MKRKIIQIVDRFIGSGDEAVLVALADDGTLWEGANARVVDSPAITRDDSQGIKFKAAVVHWEWKWEQIRGLPDDNSNLSRVR
jgi:hypothetical protein